jgi:hypothetical protein
MATTQSPIGASVPPPAENGLGRLAVGGEPAGQQLRPGQLAVAAGPAPAGEPVPISERRQRGRGAPLAGSARQPRQRRRHRPAGAVPAAPGTRHGRAQPAGPWCRPPVVARSPDRFRGGPVRRHGRRPARQRHPADDRHRPQLRPSGSAGGGWGRTGRAGRLGRTGVGRDDRAGGRGRAHADVRVDSPKALGIPTARVRLAVTFTGARSSYRRNDTRRGGLDNGNRHGPATSQSDAAKSVRG